MSNLSSLLDRLREVRCDRQPFTAEHAQCICRLTNEAANEIERLAMWQPIETAPHEEAVLLYIPPGFTPETYEVGFASSGRRFGNGYSNMSWHGSATHWMPLNSPNASEALLSHQLEEP